MGPKTLPGTRNLIQTIENALIFIFKVDSDKKQKKLIVL